MSAVNVLESGEQRYTKAVSNENNNEEEEEEEEANVCELQHNRSESHPNVPFCLKRL